MFCKRRGVAANLIHADATRAAPGAVVENRRLLRLACHDPVIASRRKPTPLDRAGEVRRTTLQKPQCPSAPVSAHGRAEEPARIWMRGIDEDLFGGASF